MQLAYLSAAPLPSPEANSVQVMQMCGAFAALGHDVTLYARVGPDDPVADLHGWYGVGATFAVQRSRAGAGKVGLARHTARTTLGLLGRRPHLAYGRDPVSLMVAAALGVPVVYEVHEPPRSARAARLERRLLASKRLRRLVAISPPLAVEYRQRFGVREDLVVVAHDAAPSVADAPDSPPPTARLRAGYVGSFHPGKGLDVVVEVARRLPEVEFDVAGGTAELVAEWSRRAPGANLTWRGHVPHGRLGDVYRSIGIGLAPYQEHVAGRGGGDLGRWMSPLKLFEYMAHGVAIVASDLPSIRDILEDGRLGVLVPPADVDAWVAAVGGLVADPERRAALASAGLAAALDRYSWPTRAETVLAGLPAPGR